VVVGLRLTAQHYPGSLKSEPILEQVTPRATIQDLIDRQLRRLSVRLVRHSVRRASPPMSKPLR
jgi:hypothetical protein